MQVLRILVAAMQIIAILDLDDIAFVIGLHKSTIDFHIIRITIVVQITIAARILQIIVINNIGFVVVDFAIHQVID